MEKEPLSSPEKKKVPKQEDTAGELHGVDLSKLESEAAKKFKDHIDKGRENLKPRGH